MGSYATVKGHARLLCEEHLHDGFTFAATVCPTMPSKDPFTLVLLTPHSARVPRKLVLRTLLVIIYTRQSLSYEPSLLIEPSAQPKASPLQTLCCYVGKLAVNLTELRLAWLRLGFQGDQAILSSYDDIAQVGIVFGISPEGGVTLILGDGANNQQQPTATLSVGKRLRANTW
eukprot:8373705-Pyramimonas_sp.AAC.1